MKAYDRVITQQKWFRPSISTGLKGAQYSAMIGGRYAGSKGMIVGGALGFLVCSIVGGALDDLDTL